MMRSQSANGIGCAPSVALRIRAHRLHDVADERAVLRPRRARSPAPRRSTRRRRRRPPRSRRPCSGRSSSCSRRSRAPSSRRCGTPARSRTAPRCRGRRRRARPSRRGSISVGVPVGPIRTTGSPGCSCAHRSDEPPISSTIVETRPRSRSTHAPVSARPSIASRVPARTRGERFVVLQAVELARREARARPRRAHDDLDDRRRQPFDALDRRAQLAVEHREELGVGARRCAGATLREHPRHDRVALLGARHRLHHVAEERRMQVAEEARRAAVGADVGEHGGLRGLARPRCDLDRRAVLVEHAEVLAVEMEVRGVLAREHRVGLRAGGDQDRARRQASARAYSCHTPSPSVCCSGHREPRGARRARRPRWRAASGPRRSGCPPPAPSRPLRG